MEEKIPDLIPDDLRPGSDELRPLAILRAQADNLTTKTGRVIVGKVVPLRSSELPEMKSRFGKSLVDGGTRTYGFNLLVPALDDYTYQAFRISYPVAEVYPITVCGALVEPEEVKVPDIAGFTEVLRELFSSKEFHRLVNSLMSEASALAS